MDFTNTEAQLDGIKEIFETAKTEDNWDMSGDMLFSYFFIDRSVEKLEKFGQKLEGDGYDFIDIFEVGDEETGEATGEYLLHLDRLETHTPESLAGRNVKLQKLADEAEIESYDGWEFGEDGLESDEDFDDDVIDE